MFYHTWFAEPEACARGQRRQTRGDDVREACGRLGRGEPRDAQDHTPPRALIAERATWQRLGLAGLAFTAWRRGHTLKLLVSNDF